MPGRIPGFSNDERVHAGKLVRGDVHDQAVGFRPNVTLAIEISENAFNPR
jgi:hypothetical protein